MVSPDLSHPQSFSPMEKPRNRSFWCLPDGFLFIGSAFLALLLVWSFWSFFTPTLNFEPHVTESSSKNPGDCSESGFGVN
ncbi:hypothetical protein HRI_004474700 [Hibiscus trionum]|uniref:Transmembrane protein n=1 Tax=Hibiscus trionum TaxID=183268 RepID=A0A9W7J642_HIBTR|nr:hypothetical protein HRI_004474700 [Hibiscus trionum]